jgi:hypothetical protein
MIARSVDGEKALSKLTISRVILHDQMISVTFAFQNVGCTSEREHS